GNEAIGKYKAALESGKPFDIVILYLTIRGGMGGKETVERLIEVNPDTKAIVSSGFSDDSVISDYHKYGFSARLAKPYNLEELRDTLSSLLDR
ncbi:MAG: response regulator, partial [Dissulfurispiraceae bacterium]